MKRLIVIMMLMCAVFTTAAAHTIDPWWQYLNNSSHGKVCACCGETVQRAPHHFNGKIYGENQNHTLIKTYCTDCKHYVWIYKTYKVNQNRINWFIEYEL